MLTRSRHFLRRYAVLKQRIAEGEVTMRHVPDEHMCADFLTKWINAAKVRSSIQYITNSWQTREASASECDVVTSEDLRAFIMDMDAEDLA